MKKRVATLILLGALLTACGRLAAAPTVTSTVDSPVLPGPNCEDDRTGTRLLVVVLDAVRPEYLDLVPMPNLESIRDKGISYEYAWVGQLISNTPASHVTINTGVFPRRHGIIGFQWRDQFGRWQDSITLFGGVGEGRLSSLIIQSGVHTLADLVREIYPCAHSVAVAGMKDMAAGSMGGRTSADWIIYAASSEPSTPEGQSEYSDVLPGTVRGHEPPPDILHDAALYEPGPLGARDLDRWAVDAALLVLERYQPRLLMVNLGEADIVGHATGGTANPDRMSPVMASLDEQLGRLIDWYRQEGVLEDTIIVIVSDHGMVPNERNVEPDNIWKAIEHSGTLQQLSATARTHIWLTNPSKAAKAAEAISMLQDPDILGVYHKEPEDSGYMLASDSQLEEPMRATLSYLLSTYAGPTSPDLVIVLRENTVVGQRPEATRGAHAVISWGAQRIILTISGPGIKKDKVSDYPARLVDIVPTVAALIGLPRHDWDGIVLADAYEKPASEELLLQQNRQRALGPLAYALCVQSARDRGVSMTECESIAR